MKKQIALVLALATLSTAALSGCTGGSPSGTAETPGGESSSGNTGTAGVVNVYNWGEYIDMSVLEDFEAETGIKVKIIRHLSPMRRSTASWPAVPAATTSSSPQTI